MLEVTGVTQAYGSHPAIQDVSLRVADGELVTIVGPSGCGKSTLLNLVGGLDKPTSGVVRIAGDDIAEMDDATVTKMRRRRLGFVFQFFNLIPVLDAAENAALPLTLDGVPLGEARKRAQEWLEKVGLEARLHNRPDQLSGGQQQRVAIARALAMRPQAILFDEPTSALDPERVGEVLATIRGLAQEGRTLVIVTHEMAFARDVAHQVLFMDGGRIVEQGSAAEVFNQPREERTRRFLAKFVRDQAADYS